MGKFHYNLSDKSDQDDSTTETHLCMIIQLLTTKGFIVSLLKTTWYHTDGCAKQYCCSSDFHLPSCLDLEFCIIIDRAVGEPRHGRYVVNILNAREKLMLYLAMTNLLNTESIREDPIYFQFTKVHENEEDQTTSLSKEAEFVLYIFNTRYINNNELQESTKFSNRHYHIQHIKDMQHKNFNISWDYWKFHCRTVAAEKFKMIKGILLFCIVITGQMQNLVKAFVPFVELNVHFQTMLLNLIKTGYQIFLHHLSQDMPVLKAVTIK